jgi:hypothetical protein
MHTEKKSSETFFVPLLLHYAVTDLSAIVPEGIQYCSSTLLVQQSVLLYSHSGLRIHLL